MSKHALFAITTAIIFTDRGLFVGEFTFYTSLFFKVASTKITEEMAVFLIFSSLIYIIGAGVNFIFGHIIWDDSGCILVCLLSISCRASSSKTSLLVIATLGSS